MPCAKDNRARAAKSTKTVASLPLAGHPALAKLVLRTRHDKPSVRRARGAGAAQTHCRRALETVFLLPPLLSLSLSRDRSPALVWPAPAGAARAIGAPSARLDWKGSHLSISTHRGATRAGAITRACPPAAAGADAAAAAPRCCCILLLLLLLARSAPLALLSRHYQRLFRLVDMELTGFFLQYRMQ